MPAKKTNEEIKAEVNEQLEKNIRFYKQFMTTPKEAQKPFKGKGGFEGTDINPMYRIKVMTEVFGPSGFGWWTDNVRYEFVESPTTKETHIFCELNLYVKDPVSGEISHPIYGIGGNTYIGTNKYGPTATDEAKKMAYTDALSIACKALGIGHDVWYAKDRTKYTNPTVEIENSAAAANTSAKSAENTGNAEKKEGTATQSHTAETASLIDEIAKKLDEIGKNMQNPDAKKQFAKEVIVPIIGGMNYKSCTDTKKLTALRDKLCA